MTYYGMRKCLVCGKQFMAEYAAQVTCSRDCAKKRKKQQTNDYRRNLVAGLWESVEWLNCQLEGALCRIKEDERKLAESMLREEKAAKEAQRLVKEAEKLAGTIPENIEKLQERSKGKNFQHICTNCGTSFKSIHKEDSYCSEQCEREASYGRM